MAEMHNIEVNLPAGWVTTKLETIGEWSGGGTPSKSNEAFWKDGNIPWVSPKDMKNAEITDSEDKITLAAIQNTNAKLLSANSVLFVVRSGILRRILPVAINRVNVAVNQDLQVFTPFREVVLSDFVYWYAIGKNDDILHTCSKSGTTVESIETKLLKSYPIPLPPLPEQHRIVEKLERLFARLTRAEAALVAAEAALERYRQSVLNTAFKAEDEDGNLKEGWKWVTVKDVGEVVTGTTPSTQERKYYGDEYPFYKPTDLEQGFYTEDARDHLSEMGAKIARMLPPRSILVTCIGATIGKTGFSRKEGSTNQQINAIVPNRGLVPEFGYFFVISDFFQKQIKENASSTTLPILNKGKFEKLPFVQPTTEVQNQIVLQIENAMTRASSLHETISQVQSECTQLRQSILQEAFGGRLVPQIQSDEPASSLIERMKSARDQQEKSNKQRGKSPSKNIEKKMAKVKEGQPILDILRVSNGVPVKAQTVWLQSEFKDSIDKFYEALKVLIEVEKTVKETREGDITYLILNDEN